MDMSGTPGETGCMCRSVGFLKNNPATVANQPSDSQVERKQGQNQSKQSQKPDKHTKRNKAWQQWWQQGLN